MKPPTEQTIVICGFHDSGKSTFLAALWHLVTSRELDTVLHLGSLKHGNYAHLNALAARWRNAKQQEHTQMGSTRLVSMELLDKNNKRLQLTFPDLSGEAYRIMWEERECDPEVYDILVAGSGVLLFVHADRIEQPLWVVDIAAMSKRLGLALDPGKPVEWHPSFAPTQIKVFELLQFLHTQPLDIGRRRLAIMLSAWDKVEVEQRTPEAFLAERMPLLDQYLRQNRSIWDWRVYGVSAQGGEYEKDKEQPTPELVAEIQALRAKPNPSERIRLVGVTGESHDLTEPIAWLMV